MKWLLAVFLGISAAQGAEISLYAINSPVPLNWETPRSLLMTTIRSSVNPTRQGKSNHTIGHAFIGIKCDGEAEVLSGMTSGKGFTSRNNLFNEKHGISVILQDNPGRFEDHERVRKSLDLFLGLGDRTSVMKLVISNEQCLKAKAWYQEYAARSEFIYGGVAKRPLNGEGAGCTAYVMSFFEYADLNYQFFNSLFEQTIHIPKELLGGDYGEHEVPLSAIMNNRQSMSQKADNTLEVKLYDPNTMYNWIVKTWKSKEVPGYEVRSSVLNKSKLILLKPI